MKPLHLPTIRAEFPALQSNCVYLDNAGGSQVLRRVADRIHDYLLTTSVQLGASYAQSQRASEKVLAARRAVSEMINAAHEDEGHRVDDPQRDHDPTRAANQKPGDSSHNHSSIRIN